MHNSKIMHKHIKSLMKDLLNSSYIYIMGTATENIFYVLEEDTGALLRAFTAIPFHVHLLY